MDPPFRRARLPRAAKDKVNPERSNPHAQSENASSNMLPKPFGPEGSEQDGHRAQTAHRIQEMNLSNPPQIGQDDATSRWEYGYDGYISDMSEQEVIVVNDKTKIRAISQRRPAPQSDEDTPEFKTPKRRSHSAYDDYGKPVSQSRSKKPSVSDSRQITNTRTTSEDLALEKLARKATEGVPPASQFPSSYGRPFEMGYPEPVWPNPMMASPFPQSHDMFGAFGPQSAGPYPIYGYAAPRPQMSNLAPMNNFQQYRSYNPVPTPAPAPAMPFYGPGPVGNGGSWYLPYFINSPSGFGPRHPRHSSNRGRGKVYSRGRVDNHYNVRSASVGKGRSVDFLEPVQEDSNPKPSNALMPQDIRSQMGLKPIPASPQPNSHRNSQQLDGQSIKKDLGRAVIFSVQGRPGPTQGMGSSMANMNDVHQNSTSRAATPSISGSNKGGESGALILRDNQSQAGAGSIIQGGSSFRPSRMKLEIEGMAAPKVPHHPGSKYLGDPNSKSFSAQIEGLPDDQNCALWITKLHPQVDLAGFLNLVRTGAVFACTINEPEKVWTKAAKLVFKTHQGAARFLAQTQAGFEIGGMEIHAIWNRVGYRANNTEMTRCLEIRGPANFMIDGELVMNYQFWYLYFTTCVVFELEGFREWSENMISPDTAVLEFRFARIDGLCFYLLGNAC